MNWYRNAHPFINNKVKQHYTDLVQKQIQFNTKRPLTKYRLEIDLYYHNLRCDGSNVFALIEKYVLDALQKLKWVEQDSVRYHKGTITNVIDRDNQDPRVEIRVKGIK